jgi:O-antigen ligase
MLILLVLGAAAAVCAIAGAMLFPLTATGLWMLAVEATPDMWQSGDHETLIGVMKRSGLGLALLLALRFGWRRDVFNPGFAFILMFFTGLIHGLYPGLGFLSSLRSLMDSAAPFAFSFARTGEDFRRVVTRMAILGPLVNIVVGAGLSLCHVHPLYTMEGGALRLAGAGLPAFLGGFALIAIYAGLLEILRREERGGERTWPDYLLLAVNAIILLLTGARAPLVLAGLLILGTFLLRRRLMALAASGALLALAVLFAGQFSAIRVVNLLQGGQAGNLSNRNLIWPDFEAAIATSPWLGWGVGAGKQIVPTKTGIATLLGTNAAHNEYLRIGSEGGVVGVVLLVLCMGVWVAKGSRHLPRAERWFMRLVFIAFAVHSATDNTLIATTSSVLFIWASAVFSAAAKPYEEVA